MKKLTTRQIALNGVVAGLYAAITILTASFAYGNIQFRIADSLCVLVVLEPSLTVGLTLGCLISNIFSTVSALDIVIGTAGTLLGCLLAARVKKDWLVPVPIMLANAVLVGAMLAYVLTPTALVQGFFINGGDATINPHFDLCAKEITLVGSWVYTLRDYATTFDFLKRAQAIGLPIKELITHRFPLEEINEALKTNLSMKGLKIAVINK